MGQLGAVDSATVCSDTDWQNDNCATSAQIGEIATTVKALGLTLTASGGVYPLPKTGTEAARIGITALNALSSPMHIEGVMRVRDDYGIKSIVPLIPNTATVTFLGIPLGNTAIDITQMNLTLYGKIAKNNANKGFMFNPPACGTATTNLSATAWDNQTDTGSASYTVTNCASAPLTRPLRSTRTPRPPVRPRRSRWWPPTRGTRSPRRSARRSARPTSCSRRACSSRAQPTLTAPSWPAPTRSSGTAR